MIKKETIMKIKDKVIKSTPFKNKLDEYLCEGQLDLVVNALITTALMGDVNAIKLILERMDGKLTDKIEITADDEVKQFVIASEDLRKKIRG
jgi:hypothetical protein